MLNKNALFRFIYYRDSFLDYKVLFTTFKINSHHKSININNTKIIKYKSIVESDFQTFWNKQFNKSSLCNYLIGIILKYLITIFVFTKLIIINVLSILLFYV